MSQRQDCAAADRRGFLKLAGLKLAGLGAVAGGAALVAGEEARADEPRARGGAHYRESEHVKAFYETARF